MKYKVLTPMARIGQPFMVGDPIEIENKAEAKRMIEAGIVAPFSREVRVETADAQPVGVEKAVKAAVPHKAVAGKKAKP